MISLAYVVMKSSVNYHEITNVLAYYIPRLSFIVFIEVFAYFFLKLYKSSLEDIKYYQNELTNVESKIISLKSSILLDDNESLKAVIKKLSSTERNFVLRRGETTVDLQKSKMEAQQIKDLLNVGKIFPKINKIK